LSRIRKPAICYSLWILVSILSAKSPTSDAREAIKTESLRPTDIRLARGLGKLPLAFEPNMGQAATQVRFLSRSSGFTAFFTDSETVFVLGRTRSRARSQNDYQRRTMPEVIEHLAVKMKLENANRPSNEIGLERLSGVSNYLIGNDPARWRTHVPHYGRLVYKAVYPGIDLVWYGTEGRFEFDFVVSPKGNPNQIQIAYEGAESLSIASNGDLILRTRLGELRSKRPRVFQDIEAKQTEVLAKYEIVAKNRVRVALARYDRQRELRIDPVVLAYSTYLGGSGSDYGLGIAVDASRAAYITGSTSSINFPTQSAFQSIYQDDYDAFVTKLAPGGNALIDSTYIGGSNSDSGEAIALDRTGSVYITGNTASYNFPTMSAYQPTLPGINFNAFVTKLVPTGDKLVYSTFLGGNANSGGAAISVDGGNSAYVTGYTSASASPYRRRVPSCPPLG
jgi:hypothetical protein